MYLTQTDIANLRVNISSPLTIEAVISDLIEDDTNDELKLEMIDGLAYYKNKADITDRKIYYWEDDTETEDEYATNNQLAHNFFKVLIEQKKNYIASQPVVISTDTGDESQDTDFAVAINDALGIEFDDFLQNVVKYASIKGKEWIHPFYDSKGNFRYIRIPAEQIIPIYDNQYNKDLIGAIRYYTEELMDNKGNEWDRYRVEWWDDKQVLYFVENDSGVIVFDNEKKPNPRPHWQEYNTSNPEQREARGWGRVPFICVKNNEEEISDLRDVKSLIDDYDKNRSDMSNTLEDFHEALHVLKGYGGTELKEFKANMRRYKAVKVDEDGDVSIKTIEIPVEARERHSERLHQDIFTFGMGVDPKTDRFGQNPTGVALKFLYSLLDLKASSMITKTVLALYEFMWFVVDHINRTERADYDYTDLSFTFNKSMIANESEAIKNAQVSKGLISDKTIVANHPWVDDEELEMKRIENEETDRLPISDEGEGDDE